MLSTVRVGEEIPCHACDRVAEVTGYVRLADDVVDAVLARLEGLAPDLCDGCARVMRENALVTLRWFPRTAEEEEREPWLY
jgi:predicted Fe-S protein YdhL (DUF1289 family)